MRSAPSAPPRESAKAISVAVPATAAAQNCHVTRSCVRSTASSAVVSGMKAAITATCADVVRSSASAIRIGQPKTAPSIVNTSGRRCAADGSGTRRAASSAAASAPAIKARPVAVKSGLNPPTATFVSGTENENMSTPAKAHSRPSGTGSRRFSCTTASNPPGARTRGCSSRSGTSRAGSSGAAPSWADARCRGTTPRRRCSRRRPRA